MVDSLRVVQMAMIIPILAQENYQLNNCKLSNSIARKIYVNI